MRKQSTKDSQNVRAIVKTTGLKLPVRLTQSRKFVYIGTQCKRLGTEDALRLIGALEDAGWKIDMRDTVMELAAKGLFDVAMVY